MSMVLYKMLVVEDVCYLYLGGSKRKYFKLRLNNSLKYEIIKWSKDMEYDNLVLRGGYGVSDDISI